MMSTEEMLRLTVAALMQRTGERQAQIGAALDVTQAQVSKKQAGKATWTLDDVDRLAAHWGMTALDLLAGPTHAASRLRQDRIGHSNTQTTIPLPAGPADDRQAVPTPTWPAPAPVRRAAPAHAVEAPTAPPAAPSEPVAEPPTAEQGPVRPPRRPAPTGPLPDLVRASVARALAEHQVDVDAPRFRCSPHTPGGDGNLLPLPPHAHHRGAPVTEGGGGGRLRAGGRPGG